MASGTVNARWVGPFVGLLPDGTELTPGESTAEVPAGEAEASPNWKPVSGSQGAKPKRSGKTKAQKAAEAKARRARKSAETKARKEAEAAAQRETAEREAAAAEQRENAAAIEAGGDS